jgi:AsmA family protein
MDAIFTAALQNGRLQVNPLHLGLAGGTIDGETTVDVTGETPRVSLRLQGRQIEIGALDRNGPISGGKSDLKVHLSASGNSVRALMASATGESSLSVGQGRLRSKTLDTAAGDLLVQVLGALNPFAKAEDSSQLVCAAARFVLKDGIATADNGLAMRTSQVDVMGSGTVNLRTEGIDVAIKPRARGATGLSLTTPLAGLIKVEGTIAHPSVVIDTAGTFKTAASVGAGIATGGLTTLGEILFDKVTADDDPCSTALRAPQPAKTPTKTEPSPKKSGGLLQGIFGK